MLRELWFVLVDEVMHRASRGTVLTGQVVDRGLSKRT